jgi:hypothetical protein
MQLIKRMLIIIWYTCITFIRLIRPVAWLGQSNAAQTLAYEYLSVFLWSIAICFRFLTYSIYYIVHIVTGCCRCNRIPGTPVPLPLNGEAISVVTVSYSENKPTAMRGEYTTDVSPVTNPSQCRNEPWDMVSSLPSASAHHKESRAKTVSQRVSEPAGEDSSQ